MSSCHDTATAPAGVSLLPPTGITVALAGQPNVGKSTVFNMLTGLNQHVGNWPGKTIEQRSGLHQHGDLTMQLVDLPGAYSLTANSPEELLARDYIITQRPQVVAAVVNAASLEHSLYLVAELMALDAPLVVGLNMVDVAEEQGMKVEAHVLEAALGVPVVPMVAARNQGVQEFVAAIAAVAQGKEMTPSKPEIQADHRDVLDKVLAIVAGAVPAGYPEEWVALKLLEGDANISDMMRPRLSAQAQAYEHLQTILHEHEDAILSIAGGRYEWIGRMVRAAVSRPRAGRVSMTERIDRAATHPLWGLGLLGVILAAMFGLTYAIGTPIQQWLDAEVVQGLAGLAAALLAGGPAWLQGLVVDGILGGVGTMITFIPLLAIFFGAMAVLEDVGYMARAAYVMDRFMHLMGLHGKSFLPLFLGFGCNVPAVLGTRVIEARRARLMTILLAPLVPCTARMAVVAVIAPAFFGAGATLVSWSLVMLGLLALALLGVVLSKTVLRGEQAAFIMELPLYHKPHLRSIAILVWQRSLSFLRRAGTLILAVSVVVWALSYFPNGDPETSLLAALGRLLAPLGAAMGLDWKLLVALFTSFVAKENSIATLGVLLGSGEEGLTAALQTVLTPAAALAFLVVQMLFIPCLATVATMRQETNSWRWTLAGAAFLFVISFAAAIGTYQALTILA